LGHEQLADLGFGSVPSAVGGSISSASGIPAAAEGQSVAEKTHPDSDDAKEVLLWVEMLVDHMQPAALWRPGAMAAERRRQEALVLRAGRTGRKVSKGKNSKSSSQDD
jgi:hypothetical protein